MDHGDLVSSLSAYSSLQKLPGWDRAHALVAQSYASAPERQKEAVDALDWFRSRLEVKDAWPGWDEGRPLASQFRITYNDGPSEGVRLFRLLRDLGPDAAVIDVVRRLGETEWHKYLGARMESKLAGRMRQRGLDVTLVEPSYEGPRPDFVVKLLDRPVAFECTAQNETAAETAANAVIDSLFSYPMRHQEFSGAAVVRFQQGADAVDAHDRLHEIVGALWAATTSEEPVSIAGLCTVTPIREYSRFVTVDGGLVTGDGYKPFVQIARTIRNKVARGQLQGSDPAVLAIRTRHLAIPYRRDVGALADALAEHVSECLGDGARAISGVLLVEEWRDAHDTDVHLTTPAYRAAKIQDADGPIRLVSLVKNPGAAIPLTEAEIELLAGSDMVW